MINIKCVGCGKKVARNPRQIRKHRAFCSRPCYYEWKKRETERKTKIASQIIIEKRGGICKGFYGTGSRLKVCIVCRCGCEWTPPVRHIVEGTWCPECGEIDRIRARGDHIYSTEEVRDKMIERGYELKSVVVGRQCERIDIKCSFCGREWSSNLQSILRGGGCPYCHRKCNDMENRCRVVFETIFGKPFVRCKPFKPGSLLELDGYNEEVKIAFEYDGPQHRGAAWFPNDKKHRSIEERDCEKDRLCRQMNIRLIRISDTETSYKSVADIIIEKLRTNGIMFNQPNDEMMTRLRIPTDSIYKRAYGTPYLRCLQIACESHLDPITGRAGQLLDDLWVRNDYKYRIVCEKGHPFEMASSNVINGSWCPVCRRGSANVRYRIGIDACRCRAVEMGGECLSTEYKNTHAKLDWRCAKGHQWSASWASVGYLKHWCPECAHKTPWNKGKKGLQIGWNKGRKTGFIPWNKGKKTGVAPPNKGQRGVKTIPFEEVLQRAQTHVAKEHPGGKCLRIWRAGTEGWKFYRVMGLFVCDKGHGEFETEVRTVLRGHWCRRCDNESRIGRPSPMRGKHYSEEVRLRMGTAQRKRFATREINGL